MMIIVTLTQRAKQVGGTQGHDFASESKHFNLVPTLPPPLPGGGDDRDFLSLSIHGIAVF